jgi:HK97 family phage prohead protease/HK97 family phage major capsid protein
MEQQNNKQEEILRKHYDDSVEVRTMEIRAEGDAEQMRIQGYAAVFNQETDLGYFREMIAPGAFDDVMEDDVRLLLNHDGAPLARTTNGTLTLAVDEEGLMYEAILSDTTQGRDLYKMIERGDITQSSFAFTIKGQEMDKDTNLRTITKVGRLLDVSPVTYPAYPQASVMARSEFAVTEEPQVEDKEVREEQVEDKPKVEKSEVRNLHNTNTKNMTLKDIKAQRSEYYNEFVAIGNTADAEGRVMTEAEQERSDKLDGMIADLDIKIKHKTREQEMVARMAQSGSASTSEQREVERVHGAFSISRAVAQVANGRNLEGAEAEWAQEAQKEARSQGLQMAGQIAIPSIALRAGAADNFQAGSGDGSGFVPTNVPAAIEALRAPTVIEGLGTTVIRNATGTLKFPRVSVKAAGHSKTEVEATANSGMEMDELTLTPQRVTAKTVYSKQLVLQGGAEVDALIAGELGSAMNAYIDDACFDTILASSAINVSTTGDTSLNAALAFKMEAEVLEDGGNLAGGVYVMSPLAYQLSKAEAAVASVSPLWENGQFNGFRAVATPYLVNGVLADTTTVAGQMLFGNFAQGGILAYFGGIDLLVDPYSAAGNAQITLHVNRFFDFDVRQPGALAKATQLT